MRAEILKYDVNAPREQGFSNQRMYPDTESRIELPIDSAIHQRLQSN